MGALRRTEDRVDGRVGARPVDLEFIERTRRRKAFQHALVDGAWIDAPREVRQVDERLAAACRDDRLDRLRADALERRQRTRRPSD